jgi:ABC-type enterobactin transport system permease subunit
MVDVLLAGGSSDSAFWLVLVGVGVIAVLFSLKAMLHERHEAPRHKPTE